MWNVPSMAVLCSESNECFPGMTSKFYFKPFVNVLVAPIITRIFIHFMFHIHCISIHKLLYFSFFSASFCMTFMSNGISTSIIVRFLFLSLISCLFAITSLCVPLGSIGLSQFHVHILICVCVYTYIPLVCKFDVQKLYRVSLHTHSLPKWGILR